MSTFTYLPSYNGSSADTTPRVRVAQFGDGYAQRVINGINFIQRSWSLQFELPKPDMDAIESFFMLREGVEAFTWTPPTGPTGRWVCASWKRTPVGFQDTTISATFTEVFGE